MKRLLPHSGEVYYHPDFFSSEESKFLFDQILETSNWRQQTIKLFGKTVMQPRLISFYGDEGISYTYSGLTLKGDIWTNALIQVKNKIEQVCDIKFNSALLNLYRDGKDSMGWHRDNEKELGLNPVIASISFGAERKFQFREYQSKKNIVSIFPNDGSLILMKGETQNNWEHSVSKTKKDVGARINITFRRVT